MTRKLSPTPWSVAQYNKRLNCAYKPVDIIDAKGQTVLRVGDNKNALILAKRIVRYVNSCEEN